MKSPASRLKPDYSMCDFDIENDIGGMVFGVDEVGRGPLAGPVVAAAIYIPPSVRTLGFVKDIKDSKKLSHKKLETLYALIMEKCVCAICEISPQEIDEINILQASLKAMRTALVSSGAKPEYALIDGNKIPGDLPCPAQAVVKGDAKSKSIAAASIIAKVTRDRIMHDLSREFPYYGWDSNVGYPSSKHLEALKIHGVTPHHRRSFRPVREALESVGLAA